MRDDTRHQVVTATCDRLDLAGKRVLVTSSHETAQGEVSRLVARGATPIHIPLVEVLEPADHSAALDAALERLSSYRWIAFTSRSAVRVFSVRLGERALPTGIRVAAVGRGTEQALRSRGIPVEVVAARHDAEGLLEALQQLVRKGERLLWPRAREARPLLADGLRAVGFAVDDIEAYAVDIPRGIDRMRLAQIVCRGGADAILFDSPSAVKHFVALVGREEAGRFACRALVIPIGPATAQAIWQEIGCEGLSPSFLKTKSSGCQAMT